LPFLATQHLRLGETGSGFFMPGRVNSSGGRPRMGRGMLTARDPAYRRTTAWVSFEIHCHC
jgi:hypothetical protein